jgi:hypothetical protein
VSAVSAVSAISAVVPASTDPNQASPSASPPPLAYNCQAPLVVIEEVSRLLTVAATHATRSAACVDGPGRRISIDEILVCPAASPGRDRVFDASYRVTTFTEGDTRACAPDCAQLAPATQRSHRARFTFIAERDGFLLEVPVAVEGLPADATALGEPHDGDCYGPSESFVPQTVTLR